jgi:hypothetical protein
MASSIYMNVACNAQQSCSSRIYKNPFITFFFEITSLEGAPEKKYVTTALALPAIMMNSFLRTVPVLKIKFDNILVYIG